MAADFEKTLRRYAQLVLQVGLNLQPGQRLLVGDPAGGGVPLHAAPFVRELAAGAYRLGARLVDVLWGDERLMLLRFQQAPGDSFDEYPAWQAEAMLAYVERGDAVMTLIARNPDLLEGQDADAISATAQAARRQFRPAMDYIARNATNWVVVSAAAPAWAAKVFPDVPETEREARLWQAIFEVCRLNQADPLAAWEAHVQELSARSERLNRKRYAALKFTAPGTDLTIGLPEGHHWEGARATSETGIEFTANLPTEEVFTLPHKDKTEGVVSSSRPLPYGGTVIEDFSLTFEGGRVVKASAGKGEAVLRSLLETDEGAGRLGEVALVPHSSPISRSGLLFYNVLFDENAASHIALGRAYKFSLQGGQKLSDDEFMAAGGNHSLVHVDFMIGSGEMDVDGLTAAGEAEPVMRGGEWAFDV